MQRHTVSDEKDNEELFVLFIFYFLHESVHIPSEKEHQLNIYSKIYGTQSVTSDDNSNSNNQLSFNVENVSIVITY
jgi:hypothetical protein